MIEMSLWNSTDPASRRGQAVALALACKDRRHDPVGRPPIRHLHSWLPRASGLFFTRPGSKGVKAS